jgi:hypothetical protein
MYRFCTGYWTLAFNPAYTPLVLREFELARQGGKHMPQVSAELRWFLNATNFNDVDAFDRWFKSETLSPGGGKRKREDVYAVVPRPTSLE